MRAASSPAMGSSLGLESFAQNFHRLLLRLQDSLCTPVLLSLPMFVSSHPRNTDILEPRYPKNIEF